MDDEQYRQARDAIDQPPCVYGKALQYGYFACQHARTIALGEREAVHCGHARAYAPCHEFHALTLRKSGFALGAARLPAHLTFNKAMQVQIGGLQGVLQLLVPASKEDAKSKALPDVATCFERLKAISSNFSDLDFSVIIPHVQQFSLRKRGR